MMFLSVNYEFMNEWLGALAYAQYINMEKNMYYSEFIKLSH